MLLVEAGDEDTNPAIHDVMRLAELVDESPGLGLSHGPAEERGRPAAPPPSRQGAGRLARPQRRDLGPRVRRGLRALAAPRRPAVGMGRRQRRLRPHRGVRRAHNTRTWHSPGRWTSPSPGISIPSSSRSSTPRSRPAWSSTPTTTRVTWTASPRCSSPSAGPSAGTPTRPTLKPVRGQENLQVVTGARVNRLIIEDGPGPSASRWMSRASRPRRTPPRRSCAPARWTPPACCCEAEWARPTSCATWESTWSWTSRVSAATCTTTCSPR